MAQLPPQGIYWLNAGQATLLARGQALVDARLVDDELGLIYGNRSGEGESHHDELKAKSAF